MRSTIRYFRLDNPSLWLERLVIWSAAVCAAALVVAFARVTDIASAGFQSLVAVVPLAPLILTPMAGMLIAFLTGRWFPQAAGSGIPQTIAAVDLAMRPSAPARLLAVRVALAKLVLGSAAIGAGFSSGREGPSVQIGAAVMNAAHRFLPVAARGLDRRRLIVAGGAAGIAAAFNTPLAGVVFAIEELSRRFEQGTNGLLLTAIVLAGMVSVSVQGNYLYFGRLSVETIDHRIILPVLLCALVCGIAGGLFSRMLLVTARPWPGAIGRWRARHPVWTAGACGLGVALLGLMTHGAVHGSGYIAARDLLESGGQVTWAFAPAKLVATFLSYLSGIPGGIFAPSLAVGAGLGRDLMPLMDPGIAGPTVYALCMAGFLASVTQAPITACIIVMEMIDGHEMVISLMAVSLLASLVSRLFSPPLYATLAAGVAARLESETAGSRDSAAR